MQPARFWPSFSALQRAEIAEITVVVPTDRSCIVGFSALQRAEIAEIIKQGLIFRVLQRFSALQRAEIAEILSQARLYHNPVYVSVLFNEPKLLKSGCGARLIRVQTCFSALQRAEIAEIRPKAERRIEFLSFSALQRAEIAEIVVQQKPYQRTD